jgi:hypothetical protein
VSVKEQYYIYLYNNEYPLIVEEDSNENNPLLDAGLEITSR